MDKIEWRARNIIASHEVEGVTLDDETKADIYAILRGEISADEVIKGLLAKWRVEHD